MIHKIFGALAALILLLLIPHVATAQTVPTKSYSADRFDVAIATQHDGSLLVTETVVFNFVGGPFTSVSRAIPTTKTDGITIQSASMDDKNMPQGTGEGQLEVNTGDPIQVLWHFAPTSDQRHTFALTYHVQGIVQKAQDADILDWNALPSDYQYTIRSSTVTVSYPEQATLLGTPSISHYGSQVQTAPGKTIFIASNLAPANSMEIELRFRPGSIISQPPLWQQQQERASLLLLPMLLGGIAIFLLGTFLLIWYYRRYRRRTTFPAVETYQVTAPPADLAPAIAGALTMSDPNLNTALATLFDLAGRGVLRIVEPAGGKKWYESSKEYLVELQYQAPDLLPHEQGLLALLFKESSDGAPAIKVSRISRTYSSNTKLFNEPVRQELEERGFVDPERLHVRTRIGRTSGLLFGLSLAGFVAALIIGIPLGAWPLIFLPLGLVGTSITALVQWATYSPLSDQGMGASVQWQAFSKYLGNIISENEPVPSPTTFEQYLPYATSFGLMEKWVKFFQSQGLIAVPAWFRSLSNANNNDFSSFTHMMIYVNTTTSSSSSSSGGGGSSFGSGGAAGGGSSGAS